MTGDGAGFWEHIVHAEFLKVFFQLRDQDITQGHGGGSDFGTDDLETPCYLRGNVANANMVQVRQQGSVSGKAGNNRHQVRLAGAVVTDDQQALVVDRLVKLHLRDDKLREPFCHFVGNDISAHESVCGV